MGNRTYREFMNNEYNPQEDLLNELTDTLINEDVIDDNIVIEGRTTSTVVNMLSMGLIVKIRTQTNKVKQETNTNKKLDELAKLVGMTGYTGLLGGFVSSRNNRILTKIRGLK